MRLVFCHSVLTVGLQSCRFTASASRLVNGLDNKDVLGAALQAVHGVVVLLDVGNNHPAVQRVTQTWQVNKKQAQMSEKWKHS